MYAYIKGTVEEIYEDRCVVETKGVGYNIQISPLTASKLPSIGEPVKLYTYTNVREDAFLLFGFLSRSELELFKICISVSGIGPKGGLALLSVLSPDELCFAIAGGDVKTIAKAPGIGKKTAERLVLELKDKIDITESMIAREIGDQKGIVTGVLPVTQGVLKEAVEALVALGYDSTSAAKAVSQVEGAQEMEAGEILKKALKYLL